LTTTDRTVHIRLKISKQISKEKLEQFHNILNHLDRDYPWKSQDFRRHAMSYAPYTCSVCKGRTWSFPKLAAQDIKALSKQLGIKVKILHFAPADRCKSHVLTAIDREGWLGDAPWSPS
jgi:translation initiation factor 2 beta subunit (eIF-2beta)/eIF-5